MGVQDRDWYWEERARKDGDTWKPARRRRARQRSAWDTWLAWITIIVIAIVASAMYRYLGHR